jgi:hypothetical protein
MAAPVITTPHSDPYQEANNNLRRYIHQKEYPAVEYRSHNGENTVDRAVAALCTHRLISRMAYKNAPGEGVAAPRSIGGSRIEG